MNRYVAAAVMWGLALGAVAYRYGMLPFMWESPWKHILPGIAVGLAVGASQIMRMGDGDVKRPAVPLLLGIGAVGALLAFGLSFLAFPTINRLSVERRAFPGFSIALPSGTVAEDRTGDYAQGKLTLKDLGGQRGVSIVGWDLGALPTPPEFEIISEMLVKAIGTKVSSHTMTKVRGPGGNLVDTIKLTGEVEMLMSGVACGERYVLVATGSERSPLALHERVLQSFVCKPDPTLERTAKMRFPLVLDLPGWYVFAEERDQLQITDGTSLLMMRAQEAGLKVDPSIVVDAMFKAAGAKGTITGRHGDRVDFRLEADGEQMEGWVRLVACPDATALVIVMSPDAAKLEVLYEGVAKGRCLRKGEAPQQWPAAPK